MMALPDRCQRLQQQEPVAALRQEEGVNLQSLSYVTDLASNNLVVNMPPAFVSPPLTINPPVVPSPGMQQFAPKLMGGGGPGLPAEEVGGSDEFSNLSLKRVSKALKLISPETNTAIKSSEQLSQQSSCRELEADLHPQASQSSSGSAGDTHTPLNVDGVMDCPAKTSSTDLPTGSRLRRWICPDPDSPLKTGETSSSASVASDFTLEKSISLERKDTTSELDVSPSEDSACAGSDLNPRFGIGLKDDYCMVDIPKASKLWIWMGKKDI